MTSPRECWTCGDPAAFTCRHCVVPLCIRHAKHREGSTARCGRFTCKEAQRARDAAANTSAPASTGHARRWKAYAKKLREQLVLLRASVRATPVGTSTAAKATGDPHPRPDPADYAAHVEATKNARRGGGNYASPEKVAEARKLRAEGQSVRAIAKAVGLSIPTVYAYVDRIDRSDAMRSTHKRWKAEGRPVLPPWRREASAVDPAEATEEKEISNANHHPPVVLPPVLLRTEQDPLRIGATVPAERDGRPRAGDLRDLPEPVRGGRDRDGAEEDLEADHDLADGDVEALEAELADEAEELEPSAWDPDDEPAVLPEHLPEPGPELRPVAQRHAFEGRERARMASGFYIGQAEPEEPADEDDEAPESGRATALETLPKDTPIPLVPTEPGENLTREQRRSRRHRMIRARSVSIKRMTKRELEIGRMIYPEADRRRLPLTRGDCLEQERPCPFVSCAYHLFLDVSPRTGAIKFNFPDLEVWDMEETCALDVADRGGSTLDEVGRITNITRERVRQIEVKAIPVLREGLGGFVEGEERRPVRAIEDEAEPGPESEESAA